MRIFILLMLLAMQGTAQTQVGADGIKYDSSYFAGDALNRLTIGDSTASKHYVDSVVAAGGGGSGTVTNVATGFGLTGGPITSTGTLRFDSTAVFPYAVLKRDSVSVYTTRYRGDSIVNALSFKGTGTVTSIATGLGLSGGAITTTGTILVDTANASILSRQRAANTYAPISITGTVTSVGSGYGLSGGPVTTTGTLLVDSATLSTTYVRRADSTQTFATPTQLNAKRSFVRFENGSTTVAANQTYYGGSFASVALSTTAALRRIYFTSACTITDVTMFIVVNGVGSNNSISYFIRKNNSSDTALTSSSITATSTVITTTGLSLSIAAGDYIEIKTVTTTLASSHTGYFQSGTIGIQ